MRVWFSVRAARKGAWFGRNAISPPSRVRVITIVACPEYRTRSGDTRSTCMTLSGMGSAGRFPELLRLGQHRLGVADVEEGLLGHVVQLALDKRGEALDGLLDGDV